ncbi:MAG: membrane protein insertion efficiency factor YidD [Spirochaetales bacterium]
MRALDSIVLLLLQGYRHLLSPLLPSSCRFYPSCSAYTLEAVKKYGAGKGVFLGIRRILRCHPGNPGGYDPVP